MKYVIRSRRIRKHSILFYTRKLLQLLPALPRVKLLISLISICGGLKREPSKRESTSKWKRIQARLRYVKSPIPCLL
jgi:hypothetical protein